MPDSESVPEYGPSAAHRLGMTQPRDGRCYPALVAAGGPMQNHRFVIDKELVTVGRGMDSDIVVRSAETEREHARLIYANIKEAGAYPDVRVFDAGSASGTFLNGDRVGPGGMTLGEGDRLRIGKTIFVFLIDETDGDALNRKLEDLASRDRLTGLFSRGIFNRVLPREMARAKRYRRDLSVLLVDVDGMGKINEKRGYEFGDAVLRRLAQRIPRYLRRTDFVARFGGDEIAALLVETPADAALLVGERICESIRRETFGPPSHPMHATVSVGVAPFDPGVVSARDLMSRAAGAQQSQHEAGGDSAATAKRTED